MYLITVSGKLNTEQWCWVCLSRPSSMEAPGLSVAPAVTRKRKHRQMPGQENPSLLFACSIPFSFPLGPLHLHSSIPRTQFWGNIFTLLSSFSWTHYIREIPAAQGKEAEGGKSSGCWMHSPFPLLHKSPWSGEMKRRARLNLPDLYEVTHGDKAKERALLDAQFSAGHSCHECGGE